jgi:hypothetical protein
MTDTSTAGAAVLPDPTRPLRTALRGIATLAAPTSLVTSLLFYFGWVRTNRQALDMGLHDSLLGFSTRDYVLRSLDPMFWPLTVGLVTAVLALGFHMWLVGWTETKGGRPRRPRLRRLAMGTGIVGVVSLALGTVASRIADPGRVTFLASPLLVTAGVVLAGYSLHLRRRFLAGRPAQPAQPAQLRVVLSSLIILLLFLSMFWTVERYATLKGDDLAQQIVDDLDYLPSVTIYSAKRLRLQPPVKEADLGDDGSAYRFKYTDLRLLFRSDGKFFMRPSDRGSDVNIVIAESDDLRWEFVFDPREPVAR